MRARGIPLRLLALAALVTLAFGSNVEPLVGTLRDGRVHHESSAAAIAHHSVAAGEHGHEDATGQPAHHQQHGPQHQHGTAADHCTHTHGLAMPAGNAAAFAILAVTVEHSGTISHPTRTQPIDSPPPRA